MVSNSKYNSEVINVPNAENKSVMKLRIKEMTRSDLGSYECVGKNAHGESRALIRVLETPKVRESASRTEADITSRLWKYAHGVVNPAATRKYTQDSCQGLTAPVIKQRIKDSACTDFLLHLLIPHLLCI